MCQGTSLPFHPCSDDLGKHRKYEEALGLRDGEKVSAKQNWQAEVKPELLTGRWMEVVWTRGGGRMAELQDGQGFGDRCFML